MNKIFIIIMIVFAFFGCKKPAEAKKEAKAPKISVPKFNSDSAYLYVKSQVDFGPRVPNTPAQLKCAAYLSETLKRFGAKVTEQKAEVTEYDGKKLRSINIIGSFNPEAKDRIILFSHWDSRPWADHDPNPANRKKPVTAANDGASGVGVLLEIARQMGAQKPNIGVDIIFFDTEDDGAPSGYPGDTEDSWCLGTQYWANHLPPGYHPKYGILLDMVGAPGATFYREPISDYYASFVVDKVWNTAADLGFDQYFINQPGDAITDDHYFVNKIANIPSIDIIQYNMRPKEGFAWYWHTIHDTMKNIDKNTLYVVGTTLLNVIYHEK